MIKRLFLLVFCALLLSSLVSAVVINEIKVNGDEWIEIYNSGSSEIDLGLWSIEDGSTNLPENLTCEGITGCNLTTSAEYFLILGQSLSIGDVSSYNLTYFYVDDQKIGNGLNDGGDSLVIKENGSVIVNISYTALANESLSWQENGTGYCQGLLNPGTASSCLVVSSPENQTQNQSTENQTVVVLNCSNISVVDVSYPTSIKYGSNGTFLVDFNATCYNHSSVKLLVYGESRRIITYQNGTKVKKYAECGGGSLYENLENKTYSWGIPYYAFENCEENYDFGNQSVALRVCKLEDDDWKLFSEEVYTIRMLRQDDGFCATVESAEENETVEESGLREVGTVIVEHDDTPKKEVVADSGKGESLKIAVYLLSALLILLVFYLISSKGKI